MGMEHYEGAIEALLFAMGKSVELSALAKAIGHDTETTRKIIRNMMLKYNGEDRGIKIIELENSYQMCTKEEYYDYLVKLALQPKKAILTDVMLETLSIVAYKQPVTKLEIEKIRGVKCDHAINKLIEYNLVQEVGRLDAPGRPILFGTTQEFLRRFGVSSLAELPEVSTVKMEDFKAEAEAEIFKDDPRPENDADEHEVSDTEETAEDYPASTHDDISKDILPDNGDDMSADVLTEENPKDAE